MSIEIDVLAALYSTYWKVYVNAYKVQIEEKKNGLKTPLDGWIILPLACNYI